MILMVDKTSVNKLDICTRYPVFPECILFSDEATFTLNGTVNRQNCQYWTRVNPNGCKKYIPSINKKISYEQELLLTGILGSFFYEDNLNGERYLEFLQMDLVSALAILFTYKNDPNIQNINIWLQHDDAPPH